jgi:phosphoribosylanthranilate isomerase
MIVDALPPFVTAVGLFVNAEPDVVRKTLAEVPLQLLQFHGDETPAYCSAFGVPYLKAVRVRPGVDLLQYGHDFREARGLLLDAFVEGVRGGTGATFDWNLIPRDLGCCPVDWMRATSKRLYGQSVPGRWMFPAVSKRQKASRMPPKLKLS